MHFVPVEADTDTSISHHIPRTQQYLPVTLCYPLQLILLFDCVAVAASLRRIDQLLSQTLSHALDIPESCLAGTDGKESDGLVDTAQRGDIDSLAANGTGGADTSGVFPWAAVDNGIDGDLDRVLVGHYVDLRERSDVNSTRGDVLGVTVKPKRYEEKGMLTISKA